MVMMQSACGENLPVVGKHGDVLDIVELAETLTRTASPRVSHHDLHSLVQSN